MPGFNVADHNNKLAFSERANDLRDAISSWANENHVRLVVIGPEWPEPSSKIRLSQEGSRAFLEIESMPPEKLADSRFYGPGRGIVVTSNMDGAKHALIIDRADKNGWLLLGRDDVDYKMPFDDARRGFPIADSFDVIKPLLVQVFRSEQDKAAALGAS
jgi:hypothetical protein